MTTKNSPLSLIQKLEQAEYKHTFVFDIRPKPAPRPRKGGFMPKSYTNYKDYLIHVAKATYPEKLKQKEIHYYGIYTEFYYTLPKSKKGVKKKDLWKIENDLILSGVPSGDIDNLQKGIFDGLEQAGVLSNDKEIAISMGCKGRTLHSPFIVSHIYGTSRQESPFRL